MSYRNEFEFRAFGLKRSGNHPIIMWIASLFDNPVYFYNCCDVDPFRTRFPENKVSEVLNLFHKNDDTYRWNEEDLDEIRCKKKNCIIYSYENKELKEFTEFIKDYINEEYMVGTSKHCYDILILRDFYNFVASTIYKRRRNVLSNHKTNYDDGKDIWVDGYMRVLKLSKLWVEYAKEFIEETDYLNNKISISFNQWVSDEYYRMFISSILGLRYSDKTLDYIGHFGQGSSFSNVALDGQAKDLDVLNRWKAFEDNSLYWNIIDNNPEAVELSNRIFGRTVDEY